MVQSLIVVNSAHRHRAARFSLHGLESAQVTPYLTDATHQLSAQPPITVGSHGFTATLPPPPLVTYEIRS